MIYSLGVFKHYEYRVHVTTQALNQKDISCAGESELSVQGICNVQIMSETLAFVYLVHSCF